MSFSQRFLTIPSFSQDQLRSLPPRLPAVTLSGSLTATKMACILDDIIRKRIKIVFVSPERLTSPSFRRLFRLRWNPDTKSHERSFPPVSLLCVDEAHCLSQWSFNFRPSYLRLHSMMDFIQPKSVLAITATAGPRVVTDICRTLNISISNTDEPACDDPNCGVRVTKTDRDNIDVSCFFLSSQEERLSAVSSLPVRKGKRRRILSTHTASDVVLVADRYSLAGQEGQCSKGKSCKHSGMPRQRQRHRVRMASKRCRSSC